MVLRCKRFRWVTLLNQPTNLEQDEEMDADEDDNDDAQVQLDGLLLFCPHALSC